MDEEIPFDLPARSEFERIEESIETGLVIGCVAILGIVVASIAYIAIFGI